MSLDLNRQSGIIPTTLVQDLSIAIVGCGAIGSHTAETLSKIGIRKLTVWDFDTVEAHNLANQGFGLPDLGKAKVLALKDRLRTAVGININAVPTKVTADTRYGSTVVISAVDSMSARKAIWKGVQESNKVRLFIDGRMAALYGQVYIANPQILLERDHYEDTLFDDSEAIETPCTEKATIFCASGIASWIAAIIRAYIQREQLPRLVEMDFVNMAVTRQIA